MGTTRASWDDYFLGMARQAATRATCDRRHVGCVLVRDKAVLATGYNGSLRGLDHCDSVGHLMEEGHCVRVIHAEGNALMQAARNGIRIEGATAYVTDFPCWPCFHLLAQAGIVAIAYGAPYRPDPKVADAASRLDIELRDLTWLAASP